MSVAAKPYYTAQEYLRLERAAETKSEYYNGEIFAMAGEKEAHTLIAGNVTTRLNLQLEQAPCRVYPSDMRVKVPKTGLYTYPDVSVACAEIRFEDEERDTLLNPLVIVEVLSGSTEGYDRGKKFEMYRSVASLRHYVLISQTHRHVECYTRQDDGSGWLFTEAGDAERLPDQLRLAAIDCSLTLDEVYFKVDLTADPEA